MSLIVDRRPPVGNVPCILAAHSLLVTGAVFSSVPSVWPVWALLLWQAGYCGHSGSYDWPWASRLPGPAWCRGCWLLGGRLGRELAVCRILRGPGRVLAHWWAGLGSRTRVSPETSKARSWRLAAGPGIPELVWTPGGWGWFLTQLAAGLGVSEACVGLLASGAGTQWVPGLVLACWWLG